MALDYCDAIYSLANELPRTEEFNLKSQIIRAATSTTLNIAEGSTGQSDAEQARFLGMAIRSLIETIACLHLIRRRHYFTDETQIDIVYSNSQPLARKLQAFRKTLVLETKKISEESTIYVSETEGF